MPISWENVITQYAGMKEEFTVRGAVITTAVVVCVLMGIAHIAAMMTIIDLIKSNLSPKFSVQLHSNPKLRPKGR